MKRKKMIKMKLLMLVWAVSRRR